MIDLLLIYQGHSMPDGIFLVRMLEAMEESPEERVNCERARQALETGADTVVVACPTCLSMLEDGVNGIKGDLDVCVKDIAEMMWEAIASGS